LRTLDLILTCFMSHSNPEPAREIGDKLIDRALAAVAPLVRLLVAYGVTYPRFAAALKRTFLDAAVAELDATGRKRTDSAISLLSGLQRRDTRLLGREYPTGLPAKSERVSLAQQVALRWASLPAYLDDQDNPRELPLTESGDAPSFTALAKSVSKDVHAASVLDEMVRLGLVRVEGAHVRRVGESFVPAQFDELTQLMAQSVRDHLAAAVANVRGGEPKFLEYSLFSDELRPQSADELHTLTRTQARQLFKKARAAAIEKSDRDRATGFEDAKEMRIRIGVYFYAEPMQRSVDPAPVREDAQPKQDGGKLQ
jgi:hypothetical protein